MSISGIGANIMGYCDQDIDKAVINAVANCNSSSLNCPEEIELAELLCTLHPWAKKVRYARSGGEALAIAIRIARASTGREKVAFCGYHGWHDWYLAANLSSDDSLTEHLLPGLSPVGVPQGLAGTSIPFVYNNLSDLEAILEKNKNQIAAVIMEPVRNYYPDNDYLGRVKLLAKKYGAVLIFDEVSSGFRLNCGGAHMTFGVEPDVAVFAKAMSNGYPMAAIIGRDEVMDAVQRTFISSTYWTDRIGPVAALATIKKYQELKVDKHIGYVGKKIQDIWVKHAISNGINVDVYGIYPMSHFHFIGDNAQLKMTIYVQQMLKRGILACNRFYANYAHNENDINTFETAVSEVFNLISNSNDLSALLVGDISKPGFHRLN